MLRVSLTFVCVLILVVTYSLIVGVLEYFLSVELMDCVVNIRLLCNSVVIFFVCFYL